MKTGLETPPQPETRDQLNIHSHRWKYEGKDIQMISQSKGQSLVRDPGTDSEQLVW